MDKQQPWRHGRALRAGEVRDYPHNLNLTAKGHIRLNQTHPYTVFRVRLEDIKPGTTYYYTVDSMAATGELDGVKNTVYHFSASE